MSRNQTKRSRVEQQKRASRVMMLAFAAILFLGLFAQIAMVARLAGQNKELRALEIEVRDLSATADNLKLCISKYRSLDRVAAQAERLGMEKPTEGQIRVVSVPDIIDDTSAQSAGAGAGEMNP